MRSIFVVAKVLAVRSVYAYPCCSICHRKVRRLDEQDSEERLWCSYCKKHYRKESVQYRYYVNLTVADKSGFARVTVFGKSLEAFFGLTATEFCRYLVNCERNKSLQNICIDQIVHLAMEKCFIGSMVHLVFPLTTFCSTNIQGSRGSPVTLQSVVHLPTVTSKTSGPRGNCTNTPELLASYIIRIKSENRTRMVIGVFIECIDCFKEKSCLSTEKCLNSYLIQTDDKVCECSIESASSEISFEQACFNANESESPWNNTEINLVLSMSNDDESRDDIILSSNPSLDEQVAKDHAEDVADSGNKCCDNYYVKEESVFLETSSNFMEKTDLSSLQQSFLCAPNSNISQICTSITVNHTDKFKHSSTNVPSSAVGNTTMLLQSKYSEPKKCSRLPIQADYTPDSNSLQESNSCQREANCINSRTSFDNKLAKYVQTLVSSPENFDGASPSAADIPLCKTPFLAHSNVTPQVCDSNSAVKFESMFDSPSSEELDTFLAQFDLSYPRATNVSEEISTPELFSPLEDKQTSLPCLSSTPLSSESTLYLRRTKHGNTLIKSHHSQSKKRSKTLWKYMKGVEKELTPCSVTPLTRAVINSDENQGKLEISPLLFFENSPERHFLPDKAGTPTHFITLVEKNVNDVSRQ